MNKKQPKNAGQPWDDTQRNQLREYIVNKIAVSQIADTMGRTQGAIRSELKHMELEYTEPRNTPSAKKITSHRNNRRCKTEFKPWVNDFDAALSKLSSEEQNLASRLLTAWLTQEVLTPQPIPAKNELKLFNRTFISDAQVVDPWNNPKLNRQPEQDERSLFWFVCLGIIDIAILSDSLREKFPSTEYDDRESSQRKCCSIVLVLNEDGCPVQESTYISSYVWGAGKVLDNNLDQLSGFPTVETSLQKTISDKANVRDSNGNLMPITCDLLLQICDQYIHDIKIPDSFIEKPYYVIRVPIKSKNAEPPTPEFLNSFFITDLSIVIGEVEKNNIGEGLKRYLVSHPKYDQLDIRDEKNKDFLKQLVQPCRLPLSRWVGKGRHSLSLMQQAAVNHAKNDLCSGGVMGVNGPPGTGKTTLLRDVVAEVVFQRAYAMTEFNDPNHAFDRTVKAAINNFEVGLSRLDHRLHGFEIVAASANNKAVENISLELPELGAVCDKFEPKLTYYKTVADAVASGKKTNDVVGSHSWGLAAAVLGNSKNRNEFISSFWFDDEHGFRSILESIAKGRAKLDDSTGKPVKVVREENPPLSKEIAISNWKQEKKKFLILKRQLESLINQVQEGYEAIPKISTEENVLVELSKQFSIIDKEITNVKNNHALLQTKLTNLDRKNDGFLEDRKIHCLTKPDLLSRIIAWFKRKDILQIWLSKLDAISTDITQCKKEIENIRELISNIEKNSLSLIAQQETISAQLKNSRKKCDDLKNRIVQAKKIAGDSFADKDYWNQNSEELQKSLPWCGKSLQILRDQLFESSWAVHKAFIEAAARPIRHNLSSMMEILKGKTLDGKEKPVMTDLWATLFIVVPVISTTFASVCRLLKNLPREAIGWLLIDEAGQALPQQAVGAIYRSKRTLVMGDPLQIPPVTSSPKGLLKAIFRQYKLDADFYSAPKKSAQYFADQCSWLGGEILGSSGDIWIGMPLNVHRRCEEPMFSIANNIAYCGEMIQAVERKDSEVGSVLKHSRWIHVRDDGQCNEKWSPAEGEKVLIGLTKYIEKTNQLPSLYIITPFRMVSNELRQLISQNIIIKNFFNGDYKLMWEWISGHVGTVHTFQGKEAEAVFLVLGASKKELHGARLWAGGTPNILNVAVTRAKQRLYIVGDHNAWSGVGVFQEVAKLL